MKTQQEQTKRDYGSWKGVAYALRCVWKEDKTLFFLSMLRIPTLVLLPFSVTWLAKLVVQLVTEKVSVQQLLLETGLLVVGMILLNIFNSYATVACKNHSQYFENSFYYKIYEKVMDTDFENVESFEGQTKRQKAIPHIFHGAGVGLNEIMESVSVLGSCVVGCVLYGFMLAALHPLIVVGLIALTVADYYSFTYVRKYEAGYADRRAVYEKQLEYLEHQGKDVKNGKDIRLYHLKPWIMQLFKAALKSRDHELWKFVIRQSIAHMFVKFLQMIRDGLIYAYLIYLVLRGSLQVDEFVLYFGLVGNFATWTMSMVDHFNWLARSGLLAGSVKEYLDMKDHQNRGPGVELPKEQDLPFALEIKDVTFRYPGTDKTIYEHMQLEIKPGEKLAIVGVNGAGKTTLIKLLCGLYRPSEGEILVNGKSAQEYNRDEYYTLFSTAFQDVHLLPLSVAQNIAMCPEDEIDRERVWDCLEKAGLKERVSGWKEGIETKLVKGVYEDAVSLSGGEQQKLVFARALYRDAPVLILDEPTAALDPIAENEMYLQYNALAKDKTSIFISHRLSSTRFCDRIVFIENGRICEMGTHQELMELGGGYAQMFDIQSQYYKKEFELSAEEEETK